MCNFVVNNEAADGDGLISEAETSTDSDDPIWLMFMHTPIFHSYLNFPATISMPVVHIKGAKLFISESKDLTWLYDRVISTLYKRYHSFDSSWILLTHGKEAHYQIVWGSWLRRN